MRHLIPVLALCAAPVFAEEITVQDVAGRAPVDVLYLGELHDNPWHHENQAQMVAAIRPKAIVFEMLSPDKAARVTPELQQDKDALEAALDWQDGGWPDFAMYYPIFQAAEGARFYGGEVSRDQVRAAIMGGDVADAFGEDAARFGLTEPLDPAEQEQREAEQFTAHCDALPKEMLPGMVLGQRLRDASLAREITRALDETGGPVIVITGNGHARKDWGAPRKLAPDVTQTSIAQFEGQPEDQRPFDYWIITPEAEREDPCLAFKKS